MTLYPRKKKATDVAASFFLFAYPLLTEMRPSIFAAERYPGLTGETIRSVVAMIVVATVSVSITAEGRGCDGARGANSAADDASGYVSGPESGVAMFDHPHGLPVMARGLRT
jgi:hypothetical protein